MTTKHNKGMIVGFLLPTIIVLLLIYIYPVARTAAMSFFNVGAVTAPISSWEWVGIDKYIQLFQSPDFIAALGNSMKHLLIGGVFVILLAILFGVSVSAKSTMPGRHFFRTMIYLPNMFSAIALGSAFLYFLFQEDFGLLTSIWKYFEWEPVRWLTGPNKFYAMLFGIAFCAVGYYMLLMSAGIESIPDDLYEAAVIDGAGPIRKFFSITLPLMKGTIKSIITFWSIGAMRSMVWNQAFSPMTAEKSTISPIVYMYEVLFGSSLAQVQSDAGLGSAVGITTALMVQIIYTISNKLLSSNDLEF